MTETTWALLAIVSVVAGMWFTVMPMFISDAPASSRVHQRIIAALSYMFYAVAIAAFIACISV